MVEVAGRPLTGSAALPAMAKTAKKNIPAPTVAPAVAPTVAPAVALAVAPAAGGSAVAPAPTPPKPKAKALKKVPSKKPRATKPKLCRGSWPYAPKGHELADVGCCSLACRFCCNKYGMADECPAHGE